MPTAVSKHAWFNGHVTPLEAGAPSIASINLHLGTGVFDGLMAYWNGNTHAILRAEAHMQRFHDGAARMGLWIPFSVDQLIAGTFDLLAHEPRGTQYLRPIAYRREPAVWIPKGTGDTADVSIFAVPVGRDSDGTLTCHISPVERISHRAVPGQIKVTGAYANSFYARKTAERAGYGDGIMLDRDGFLTEASSSNFFIIQGDRLLTPALRPDVFPGITRQVILELARELGLNAQEAELRPADVANIDGAFLCATLMEIRALTQLDERPLATTESAVFKSVVSAFRACTKGL
jgi:branched-chain amino acid aminotransferase